MKMANFSIIDTHTHNYFPSWDNADALFQRAEDAGVIAQVQIGADEQASFAAIELAKKYSNCYATVGLHPTDVKLVGQLDSEFRSQVSSYEPVAKNIVEVFALFDAQIDVFLRHVELAKKYNLPLIIHTRNAIEDTIEFFKKHIVGMGIRGVVHCFSEDLNAAKFFTEEAGFYLGIGGIVTYKKSDILRDVVREISLEYLVTETDSPFLPPQEFRKKNSTNESAALVEIIEKIAEVRGEKVEIVAEQLVKNAKDLYKI